MITEHAVERMRELVAAKVPFVHQGRDFNGIDCVGALAYAYQYDAQLPAYPQDPINGELELYLAALLGEPVLARASLTAAFVDVGLLRERDIVSMQYRGPVRHVAMVAKHVDQRNCPGALSVIHTDAMLGRVTEHILDLKWQRRIVKVWRP